MFDGELVIDNFAGGGGASSGIEQAIGRPIDIAVNHSRAAIAMHQANHPETRHYCEDIWEVDPREACGSRPVGLVWFSPDCFPAGTLVLTREGYRPIEQVSVGDEVLTHESRWRRVTATMSTERPLVRLRGHGHPGLAVSAEHPFYARRRNDRWNNQRRVYDHTFDPPAWVPAGDLGAGWYWATPVSFPPADVPEVPVRRGRTISITPALMWLVGRYIADGWTRLTASRAELVIICGMHEVEGLRPLLDAWPRAGSRSSADEIAWHERATGTAYQFTTSHRALVEWLREHFGHGAAEKFIPGWALGMDPTYRKALLDGYLSGDGWRGHSSGRRIHECTTVSKALAFGVKALAGSLGKTVTVALRKNNGSGFIQGRAVNALPAWSLRWREEADAAHRQTWREGALEWTPVRERVEDGDVAEVFNLSVEEDESYVVDGIVVHNCTHHSRAKGGQPRSKEIRGLAHVVIRWARAVRPRTILLENVEEFQSWGPLDEAGHPIKARAGEDFRAWLAELVGCGYDVSFRTLVAADYGTPTSRKRLFLVAQRRGMAEVAWPGATHGKGRDLSWRPAAEIIDWSLPCRSIFGRPKPLAEKTLRRIAAGLRRFVFESADPFLVPAESGLMTPFIAPVTHTASGDRVHSIREPLRTVTTAKGGEFVLVSPMLVQTGYGEREGQKPRVLDIERPLGTVVSGGKHALVAAWLTKHYGGVVGHELERTLGTVTTRDHHSLTAAFLTKFYGTSTGSQLDLPLPTVTAGGGRGGGHMGLVMIRGEQYRVADIGMRMLAPRELYRAQGFADSYKIEIDFGGKPMTKTQQIELAGNSVCPPVARVLVEANYSRRTR